MAVAIGGLRLREGKEGWAKPSKQQQKFGGFDLTSYAKGQLDFSIMPRPLIAPTIQDGLDMQKSRLENAKAADGIFDNDLILQTAGISDPDERKAIRERMASLDVIPLVSQ